MAARIWWPVSPWVVAERRKCKNTPWNLEEITTALEQNPDADFVHLSLGGNDFLGIWRSSFSQAEEDQLFADILEDITAVVDHILQQRPGIRIYWSSYDFPRPLFIGDPVDVNMASMRFSVKAQALADSKGKSLNYGDFRIAPDNVALCEALASP